MNNNPQYSSLVHERLSYLMQDLHKALGKLNQALNSLESLTTSGERLDRTELAEIARQIRVELDDASGLREGISSHLTLDDHPPYFRTVRLDLLIDQLLTGFEIDADQNGIDFDCRPLNEELPVRGDDGLLRRTLQNLIGNAIQSTPKDGFVGIETERIEGFARIVISDSGSGIPEHALRWLFEPGIAEVPSARDALDSRSLGLAYVRRVVELHGGRISVTAREGEGSECVLELPIEI